MFSTQIQSFFNSLQNLSLPEFLSPASPTSLADRVSNLFSSIAKHDPTVTQICGIGLLITIIKTVAWWKPNSAIGRFHQKILQSRGGTFATVAAGIVPIALGVIQGSAGMYRIAVGVACLASHILGKVNRGKVNKDKDNDNNVPLVPRTSQESDDVPLQGGPGTKMPYLRELEESLDIPRIPQEDSHVPEEDKADEAAETQETQPDEAVEGPADGADETAEAQPDAAETQETPPDGAVEDEADESSPAPSGTQVGAGFAASRRERQRITAAENPAFLRGDLQLQETGSEEGLAGIEQRLNVAEEALIKLYERNTDLLRDQVDNNKEGEAQRNELIISMWAFVKNEDLLSDPQRSDYLAALNERMEHNYSKVFQEMKKRLEKEVTKELEAKAWEQLDEKMKSKFKQKRLNKEEKSEQEELKAKFKRDVRERVTAELPTRLEATSICEQIEIRLAELRPADGRKASKANMNKYLINLFLLKRHAETISPDHLLYIHDHAANFLEMSAKSLKKEIETLAEDVRELQAALLPIDQEIEELEEQIATATACHTRVFAEYRQMLVRTNEASLTEEQKILASIAREREEAFTEKDIELTKVCAKKIQAAKNRKCHAERMKGNAAAAVA